jgi:RNA polymerase sigma-70 factor (ECF subfamily)
MQHSTGTPFRTTQWTSVLEAKESGDKLEDLLRSYWGPIYAYLRRSGNDHARAADLTQSFITSSVLERDLLTKVDPDRGSFRAYVLASLRNHVIDERRREHGRSAEHPRFDVVESAFMERAEAFASDSPEGAFDRQWAATTLEIARERTEQHYRSADQTVIWSVFEAHTILPLMKGVERPSNGELADRFGLAGPERVSTVLQTVKRQFERFLRQVVAEGLRADESVDEEIAKLRSNLE